MSKSYRLYFFDNDCNARFPHSESISPQEKKNRNLDSALFTKEGSCMKNSAFCFIAMNIASFVTPIIIHFLPHAKERKVPSVRLSSKSLELLNEYDLPSIFPYSHIRRVMEVFN